MKKIVLLFLINTLIFAGWFGGGGGDDNSNSKSGENNSTDHFAIIPTKYVFDVPDTIKAGETYHIEINATDNNDNNQSYDQNLSNFQDRNASIIFIHKSGDKEYNGSVDLNFSNGIANRDDFNISDVGVYILELNDTNYASIDNDDTKEENRTIYGYKKIVVIPYKYKINLKTHKTSIQENYLYQSNEHNYTLEANITALSKTDKVLTHFDYNEYAQDVNVSLKYILKKADNKDINLTYIKKENNENTTNEIKIIDGSYEINYTIKDSNFTKGESTLFGIVTYIKKDITNPNSPIDLNITEINTTSKIVENLGIIADDNISFYYPKLNTKDIFTTYKETNTTNNVIVYDSNKTDASIRFGLENEVLIEWYKNTKDNQTNIFNYIMKETSEMNSNKIDINITTFNINNSNLIIEVDNNSTPKIKYGIIHLDTPLYLWYSKYNINYDYSNSSSCINHYCIEYTYKGDSKLYDVGSGVFKGSEVNTTKDLNTSKKGVRIFR